MSCDILFQIWFIILLMVICNANHTILVVGPTGAGKSSFINFMLNKGTEVAEEGATFDAHTIITKAYTINNYTQIIDTPGLLDTRGYTTEEITQLIKSTLITQPNSSISGVILMFNGKDNKINLAMMINVIIQIFGDGMLSNVIIAYNFNDKINQPKRDMLSEWSVSTLTSIYDQFNVSTNLQQRILFIDTKGDYNKYTNIIDGGIRNSFIGDKINIIESDQSLKAEIETEYQKELKDDDNYNVWTEEIAHPEKKKRTITVNVKTPYSYKCGCEKWCSWDIGFARGDCNTYCSTCNGVKDVPTKIIEEYIDTWYEQKERRELKYDVEYLL
eukprot:228316_1